MQTHLESHCLECWTSVPPSTLSTTRPSWHDFRHRTVFVVPRCHGLPRSLPHAARWCHSMARPRRRKECATVFPRDWSPALGLYALTVASGAPIIKGTDSRNQFKIYENQVSHNNIVLTTNNWRIELLSELRVALFMENFVAKIWRRRRHNVMLTTPLHQHKWRHQFIRCNFTTLKIKFLNKM